METLDKTGLADRLCEVGIPAPRAKLLDTSIHDVFQTLVASDALGKASILRAQGKTYPPLPAGGQAQMSLVLYWLKYEPPLLKDIISSLPTDVQRVWAVIDTVIVVLYPPTITPTEYAWAAARAEGVVAPDGTILGAAEYQDFDPGWLWAFFNYLINLVDESRIAPFSPPKGGAPHVGKLQTTNDECRIALVGDWGTGKFDAGGYDPATDVLAAIEQQKPDYIIHLGDVYYAGTETAPPPEEESKHFLSMWPDMPPGRSFTLNSNHEMYGGANGYFNVALGRTASEPTPFAHQNGFSYFALTMGDTAIVGLDAAYFDPSALYMEGGLGELTGPKADPQYDFLRRIAAAHSNLTLLTHQTAMTMDGTTLLPLWSDVTQVVDAKQIRLWYWGHIHMGIAYSDGSVLGQKGIRTGCAGHGAIPMGVPWGLQQSGQGIGWFSHTKVGGTAYPNRVKNGFAMLTLSAAGCAEAFYEPGNRDPVWTRPASAN
ncbi:metallophosphoesterase family protein [Maricaulis sp. CAU 1757]